MVRLIRVWFVEHEINLCVLKNRHKLVSHSLKLTHIPPTSLFHDGSSWNMRLVCVLRICLPSACTVCMSSHVGWLELVGSIEL